MTTRVRSNAKLWAQSEHEHTRYRDRMRAELPDGTKKDFVGYGPTKQAATADLMRKVDAAGRAYPSAETVTVEALFMAFLQHKRSVKGSKNKTIFDDGNLFRVHIRPHIGDKAANAVTLQDLQAIQTTLTKAGKWRTAELATIQLKSLLSFAHKLYRHEVATGRVSLVLRDDLDAIKRPPGVTRKVADLWTVDQLEAFLALARKRYQKQPRATVYPAFYTALAAGLRRGELLGLRRNALKELEVKGATRYYLDVTEQLVDYGGKLNPDTPKTADGTRRVPVDSKLAELLLAHAARMDALALKQKRPPSPLMFPTHKGTPLTPRTLYRALDNLTDALGLPHSTLHQLRKVYTSYITRELVRAGTYSPKVVAQLLGHSNTSLALEVYTLIVQDDLMSSVFDPSGLSEKYPTGIKTGQNDALQTATHGNKE